MEVHAHTHSPRKKWTHYFWEFFMLFLAVTLGFIVENQREHFIEKKRERQYILSMIEDLKEDTAHYQKVININSNSCKKIDTLIGLLKSNGRDSSAKRIYYLARLIPISDITLVCQDKTFEQLKGSGGFRLIHDPLIQNKIGAYYQINKYIQTGPVPMEYQNRRDLFMSFNQLFDAGIIQEIMQSFNDPGIIIPENKFVLLSKDPAVINNICTRYHFMYSTKKVVSDAVQKFTDKATELILYLKKEYRLK